MLSLTEAVFHVENNVQKQKGITGRCFKVLVILLCCLVAAGAVRLTDKQGHYDCELTLLVLLRHWPCKRVPIHCRGFCRGVCGVEGFLVSLDSVCHQAAKDSTAQLAQFQTAVMYSFFCTCPYTEQKYRFMGNLKGSLKNLQVLAVAYLLLFSHPISFQILYDKLEQCFSRGIVQT